MSMEGYERNLIVIREDLMNAFYADHLGCSPEFYKRDFAWATRNLKPYSAAITSLTMLLSSNWALNSMTRHNCFVFFIEYMSSTLYVRILRTVVCNLRGCYNYLLFENYRL